MARPAIRDCGRDRRRNQPLWPGPYNRQRCDACRATAATPHTATARHGFNFSLMCQYSRAQARPWTFPRTATTRFGRRARGPALAPRRVDGPKQVVTAEAADAVPRMRNTAHPSRLIRAGSSESACPSRIVRVGSSESARLPVLDVRIPVHASRPSAIWRQQGRGEEEEDSFGPPQGPPASVSLTVIRTAARQVSSCWP